MGFMGLSLSAQGASFSGGPHVDSYRRSCVEPLHCVGVGSNTARMRRASGRGRSVRWTVPLDSAPESQTHVPHLITTSYRHVLPLHTVTYYHFVPSLRPLRTVTTTTSYRHYDHFVPSLRPLRTVTTTTSYVTTTTSYRHYDHFVPSL